MAPQPKTGGVKRIRAAGLARRAQNVCAVHQRRRAGEGIECRARIGHCKRKRNGLANDDAERRCCAQYRVRGSQRPQQHRYAALCDGEVRPPIPVEVADGYEFGSTSHGKRAAR